MKPSAGPFSWTAALLLAVVLHGALALAVTLRPAAGVAEAPGIGGIEIALGPKGGAPGDDAEAEEDTPVEETPAETAPPPPEPTPEPIPTKPAPQPRPSEPTPPPTPVPDAVPVEAIGPLAPPATPVSETTNEAAAALPASSAPRLGVGGQGGTEDSPDAGDRAADMTAGGVPGAEADYAAILLAWLQHHKRYPRRAEARRQEGVVRLFIAVDRGGEVLEGRIDRGAGYRLLDRAALDMLERAAPLPPIPDEIPGERLEIIVPVHFFLTG